MEAPADFSPAQLRSLFWHVCQHGPVAALQKLIAVHGLPADDVNAAGETPLIVAARHGATDVVRALLKHGPGLRTRWRGKTCVEWAREGPAAANGSGGGGGPYQAFQMEAIQRMTTGDVSRLQEMLDAGLDPDDGTELSPLRWARSVGTAAVVNLMAGRTGVAAGSRGGDDCDCAGGREDSDGGGGGYADKGSGGGGGARPDRAVGGSATTRGAPVAGAAPAAAAGQKGSDPIALLFRSCSPRRPLLVHVMGEAANF